MSRLFLFAIGGSGARVLRSFTMLLASGQDCMKGYDVYPIILDYDTKNGDTQIATDCIKNYNDIHKIVWKDDRLLDEERKNNGTGGYFLSHLLHLNPNATDDQEAFKMIYAPKDNRKFGEYIGYDRLRGNALKTKMLLDSLYNNDVKSDDSELNLDMTVGFKGNPNIGCVVFNGIKQECTEFTQFLQTLNNNDRVVVIGSLFGGTGSSGIPEIIRKIRSDAQQGANVPIASVLIMPYFAPEDKPNRAVKAKIFNSKTKAAINYYHDSGLIKLSERDGSIEQGSKINCAYFVGDPDPVLLPYCDGGSLQKNPANVVEFLGALSVLHFISKPENEWGCFKFGANCTIFGSNEVNNLVYKNLYDQTEIQDFIRPVFQRFTAFTVAMKYFMFKTMNADKRHKRTTYYGTLHLDSPSKEMSSLLGYMKDFWEKYKEWNDELADRENEQSTSGHRLSMFNTDDGEDAFNILYVNTNERQQQQSKSKFGSRNNQTLSIDADKVTPDINEAISQFRKPGAHQYGIDDFEFLLMHGLFVASNNQQHVITPLFSPNN